MGVKHNPVVRWCIVLTEPRIPNWMLRDDLCCQNCCEARRAMEMDPDVEAPWSPNPCAIHGPGTWEGRADV